MAKGKKKPGKTNKRGAGRVPSTELSPQERLFVNEFLIHRNGLRAYKKVYGSISYSAAGVGAHDLLKKPKIKAEISAFLKAQGERTKITADRVLKEIGLIAFHDPEEFQDEDGNIRNLRDIPQELRKAIAGIEVSRVKRYTDKETGETTEESVVKYKTWDKNAALAKLCKHLGLDTEVTPLEALLQILPADVAATVREALAKGLQGDKK